MIITDNIKLSKKLQLLPLDYRHFVPDHLAQVTKYLQLLIKKHKGTGQIRFRRILALDQKLNLVICKVPTYGGPSDEFKEHNYVANFIISNSSKRQPNAKEWAKRILTKYVAKLKQATGEQEKLSAKEIKQLIEKHDCDYDYNYCLMFTAKSYANYVVANLAPDLVFDVHYLYQTGDYFAKLLLANWQNGAPFNSINIINQLLYYLTDTVDKHNIFFQELTKRLHDVYEHNVIVNPQATNYNYDLLIELFDAYHLNTIQLPLSILGNFITKNQIGTTSYYKIHIVFAETSPADFGSLLNGLLYFHNTFMSDFDDYQETYKLFKDALSELDYEINSPNLPNYLAKLKFAIRPSLKGQLNKYADIIADLQLLADISRKETK